LRGHRFTSLAELRAAVDERVAAFNAQPFCKRAGSRLSVFTAEERPLLRPAPVVPFEIATWVYSRRVQRNGHVVFGKNFYSVPYAHIGAAVDLRVTDSTVEVFAADQRIASHVLAPPGVVNDYRTHDSHVPDGARDEPWDPARVREWAARIGTDTTRVVNRIFESVPVDEQGLDAALAVLRLSRRYSTARVEAAASIALATVHSPRYAHLRPILQSGQDQHPLGQRASTGEVGGYVRGADSYAGGAR